MNISQQKPSESRPFLNVNERNQCCNKAEDDAAAPPSDCVEQWKLSRIVAREKMDLAEANYYKANEVYVHSKSWFKKLEKWKENAEIVHAKTNDAYGELERFLDALSRTKTLETANAVEAVLCLVKSIFDDIATVSSSLDEPRGMVQELKLWIECNDSLDANKKENALGCILPFEKQMNTVIEIQDDLLNKLLEILHSANDLVAVVGKSTTENAGLQSQLGDLRSSLSGNAVAAVNSSKCDNNETPNSERPCNEEVINPENPLFPSQKGIDAPGNLGDAYYSDLLTLYDSAKIAEEKAKTEMEEERVTHDDAKACHDGLDEAIKAAEAAKPAK